MHDLPRDLRHLLDIEEPKFENPVIWELGSLFVEGFINPESLFFYLKSCDNNMSVVLSIKDLAEITLAVTTRALNPDNFVPSGDRLAF